ncbi:MAG: tetratricopeptide repeat protein [Spirochaetes bacterium]|nr:tetratricopeptide repeat protein [Spirochaetota bacterium]
MKILNVKFFVILTLILLGGCYNIFSPLFQDPANQDLNTISDINFLNDMGDYYSDLGDYITAKKFYQRALAINPNSSRALIGVANCEIFLVISRTNILGFYNEIASSDFPESNYSDFIDKFVTNSKYYSAIRVVSANLGKIISGNSDNPNLTNDINLHFNFSVFNKLNGFLLALDSDNSGEITSNDTIYNFLKRMTISFDDPMMINDYIFFGDAIDSAMKTFFREGNKSIKSLVFITNTLKSGENAIETQLLNTFISIDIQITNVYTNFLRYHNFHKQMFNRIVFLLTNNGIPLVYATNIERLTNALSISNYAVFDNETITNILTTNNSDAWSILTNYLNLNALTNP